MGNTLAWEKGRQLKTFGNNAYKYNNEGIRIQKTTSSEIHNYVLDGTNIVKEIVTDTANGPMYTNEYLYDIDGTVCGLKHNGVAYYFYKNLQGDVIAITDDTGETVARYTYDAWGKITSISGLNIDIAHINPFRYRGYYYDEEIGLYYLQSRYYNPTVGRFLNSDDSEISHRVALPTETNLFSYCANNPVNATDASGNLADQLIARIIIGLILGLLVQLLCDWILYLCNKYISKKNEKMSMHPADYVSSMITWALVCVVPNSKLLTFFTIATPIAVKHFWRFCTGKFDIKNFLYDLAVGAIAFAISCCIDRHTAQKCGKIVKRFRGDKNAASKIAASTANFKAKMKILGVKVNLTIAIAAPLLQLIYSALVMCFS